MQETFSNGEKITSHDWKLIDEMVEKLELNLAEAIELREFDKFESDKKTDFEKEQKEIKKAKNAKAKITDDEIDDLFNNVVKIAFGGKVEYKQDPVEASVEATYQPKTSSLTAALAGKYTAEKFVVEGGFGTVFAFKAEDKLAGLTANAKISSDAIVDNATLALAWESGNMLAEKFGAITASAKSAF